MATESFDSVITINNKNVDSLIDIINEDNFESVNLNSKIEVKKISTTDIKNIFKR